MESIVLLFRDFFIDLAPIAIGVVLMMKAIKLVIDAILGKGIKL